MRFRKNKKRIDPRYFLHETTYRDLDEQPVIQIKEGVAKQGRLEPYLMGQDWDPDQDGSRPLESLKGFMLGDFDLADAVRDWSHEVSEWSYLERRPTRDKRGTSKEIAAEYMKAKPDRAKAFEYLLGIVKVYDQYIATMSQQIDKGIDIGPLQAEFEKASGREMQKAIQELPKLFKPSKGTTMRAQQATKQSKEANAITRRQASVDRHRAQASAGEKY